MFNLGGNLPDYSVVHNETLSSYPPVMRFPALAFRTIEIVVVCFILKFETDCYFSKF